MEASHNDAKGVLLLGARYNKHANNAMCAVFARLEREGRRELLYKDVGLYYQSIIGTAAHSLIGSLALFVGQIAHFTQGGDDYSELLSYLTPELGLADSVLNDIATFSALQERVDSACIEIIESITAI